MLGFGTVGQRALGQASDNRHLAVVNAAVNVTGQAVALDIVMLAANAAITVTGQVFALDRSVPVTAAAINVTGQILGLFNPGAARPPLLIQKSADGRPAGYWRGRS